MQVFTALILSIWKFPQDKLWGECMKKKHLLFLFSHMKAEGLNSFAQRVPLINRRPVVLCQFKRQQFYVN